MLFRFEGQVYPSFRDLFYANFDAPLSQLPHPPRLPFLPGRAQPPLGYLCVGMGEHKEFVLDRARAPLVAEAFGLASGGTFWKDAWRKAAENGLTGRSGSAVSASGMFRLLGNPAYMGLLSYGGELFAAPFDPLVSEGLFKAAQGQIERQREDFHAERLSRWERRHWDLAEAREIEKRATSARK